MIVERAAEASDELGAALIRLLPQLSPDRKAPSPDEIRELLAQPGMRLLVARDDGGAIVGMLALLVYRIPTGLMARIDDVVVDEAARGRGVGAALTREALRIATEEGARHVTLTSRPERAAANRLYVRLGFERRETNVYVWRGPETSRQP